MHCSVLDFRKDSLLQERNDTEIIHTIGTLKWYALKS